MGPQDNLNNGGKDGERGSPSANAAPTASVPTGTRGSHYYCERAAQVTGNASECAAKRDICCVK